VPVRFNTSFTQADKAVREKGLRPWPGHPFGLRWWDNGPVAWPDHATTRDRNHWSKRWKWRCR